MAARLPAINYSERPHLASELPSHEGTARGSKRKLFNLLPNGPSKIRALSSFAL